MNKDTRIGVLLIIFGLLTFIIIAQIDSDHKSKIKISDDLPCYDKNGNVINGLTCSGELETDNQDFLSFAVLILILLGISLLMAGVMHLIKGYEKGKQERKIKK